MLGDVHRVIVVHVEEGGTDEFGLPDVEYLAFLAEHLNPVALAFGHQHTATTVDPYAMGQGQTAGLCPRLAPREQVLAVRREAVHLAIAVAIGDEDVAGGSDADACREVEWPTGTGDIGLSSGTQFNGPGVGAVAAGAYCLLQVSVSGELHDLATIPVHQPDVVVGIDIDGMGKFELSCTP